jgi:hypothetical protein
MLQLASVRLQIILWLRNATTSGVFNEGPVFNEELVIDEDSVFNEEPIFDEESSNIDQSAAQH